MQAVRVKLNRDEQSLSAHPRSRRHDRILADVARGPFAQPLALSGVSIVPAALLPRRRAKGEQDVAMLEHLGNVTARHVNREPFERPSNGCLREPGTATNGCRQLIGRQSNEFISDARVAKRHSAQGCCIDSSGIVEAIADFTAAHNIQSDIPRLPTM